MTNKLKRVEKERNVIDLSQLMSYDCVNEYLDEFALKFRNLTILRKKTIEIDGVLFVGTTLWSDIPPEAVKPMEELKSRDYKLILKDDLGHCAKPSDTLAWYQDEVAWLEQELKHNSLHFPQLPIVVLTHHAPKRTGTSDPVFENIPRDDPKHWLGYAFSSNLDHLTSRALAPQWCYGHTHYNNVQVTDSGVVLACNQRGYEFNPGEHDASYLPCFEIVILEDVTLVNNVEHIFHR